MITQEEIDGVSVIVPTVGREVLLARCMDALCLAARLFEKRTRLKTEIIICDDSGTSAASEVVLSRRKTGVKVRYLPLTRRRGPAAARNFGASIARYNLLAFTDDDCVPASHWLLAAVEHATPYDAAWGRIRMPIQEPPTDYEKNESGLTTAVFVTANCFCRAALFQQIGGFDETFKMAWREDSDLYFKLLEQNARIEHIEEALIIHPVRPAKWGISLWQQKKQYYDALLYKKHPFLYKRLIQPLPPLNYYACVTGSAMVAGGLMSDASTFTGAGLVIWILALATFVARRLKGIRHTPGHVTEILMTSLLIPFLSVGWRLYGALRFRVVFA